MKFRLPPVKNKERFIWIFLVLLVFFVNIKIPYFSESVSAEESVNPESYYPLFYKVFEYISRNYVDKEKAAPKTLIYGAIKGMLESLGDPHTAFLDQKQGKELMENTRGSFGGLGMYVNIVDGWLTVIEPMEGTPAWNAGLKYHDQIVKIEDISTKNMTLEKAVSLLKGQPGTKVTITVSRVGLDDPFTLSLIREHIKIKTVKYGLIEDTKIGYIDIGQFAEPTANDLKSALIDLKNKNMTSLIIDLRNNPGGLLNVVIQMVDYFLDEGKIVYTEGRNGIQMEVNATKNIILPKYIPMIVLINQYSASASEIFAGAMQDTKRAVLLGETSFGKFSVQEVKDIDANDQTRFRMTIAHYFTPNGRSLHEQGITPDIIVKNKEITRYEREIINKILKANFIKNYIEQTAGLENTKKQYESLIAELNKNGFDIRRELVDLLISQQKNANKMQPLYNLEADDQLGEAINVLKGYRFFNK